METARQSGACGDGSRFKGEEVKKILIVILGFVLLSSCARTNVATSGSPEQPTKEAYHGEVYKIGVILPLTGKFAIYGATTLQGIECAVGIFSPCDKAVNAELIIKDDAGRPELAAQAVEDLVQNEHVSIIIGPMASSSIEAAAQKAQSLGVPLISLSQREGITSTGENVFSVALNSASQANAIAKWAIETKKAKNFAIAYPMTPYGEDFKKLFTSAITALRGKIVQSSGYGETTLDFAGMFKKDGVKFDAIFIPDSYRAIGYVTSALLTEGIEGVQLLGINRWNNPALVEIGGESLQGAVFVDGFFDDSSSPNVQKFVSSFEQIYGIKPTILEAQSYDAARLGAKALQLTGGAHPLEVRNSLANVQEVEGSTGLIGFDSNREIIRKMFLLTVKNDKIAELDSSSLPSAPKKDKYGAPAIKIPAFSPTQKY